MCREYTTEFACLPTGHESCPREGVMSRSRPPANLVRSRGNRLNFFLLGYAIGVGYGRMSAVLIWTKITIPTFFGSSYTGDCSLSLHSPCCNVSHFDPRGQESPRRIIEYVGAQWVYDSAHIVAVPLNAFDEHVRSYVEPPQPNHPPPVMSQALSRISARAARSLVA